MIGLFMFTQIMAFSQKLDLIVTTAVDSIACIIIVFPIQPSISKSKHTEAINGDRRCMIPKKYYNFKIIVLIHQIIIIRMERQ